MIDEILHSVSDAEAKAAESLKAAKEESAQIAADAAAEADQLMSRGRELFDLESREKRKLAEEEEAVKDEEEKAVVLREIEKLKADAEEKKAQIVSQLIAELVV